MGKKKERRNNKRGAGGWKEQRIATEGGKPNEAIQHRRRKTLRGSRERGWNAIEKIQDRGRRRQIKNELGKDRSRKGVHPDTLYKITTRSFAAAPYGVIQRVQQSNGGVMSGAGGGEKHRRGGGGGGEGNGRNPRKPKDLH